MQRQMGITTKQMRAAPENAVFVWCTSDLSYPKALAKALGRHDLEIVTPRWLVLRSWRGRDLSGLVVDHATYLADDEHRGWMEAKERLTHNVKGKRPAP